MNSQRKDTYGTKLFSKAPIGLSSKRRDNIVEKKHINRSDSVKHVRQQVFNELFSAKSEVSASGSNFEKDGDNMDDTLKMMLERIERDSREREDRYHTDAQERESRYRQEMMEQNRALKQEAKEREERILAAIKESAERTEKKVSSIEDEIKLIKSDVSSNVKHAQSLVTTNIWGGIATVAAIVAMLITVVLTK